MDINADYFDGKHAGAQPVNVALINNQLLIRSADQAVNLTLAFSNCTVQPALGQSKRLIELPQGGHLSLSQEAFEALFPQKSKNTFWRRLHFVENNLGLVALALIAVVALVQHLCAGGCLHSPMQLPN